MESYISVSISVVVYTLKWNIDRVKSNKESYFTIWIHQDYYDRVTMVLSISFTK